MPKWLKPVEPAVDALAIISTAPAGQASNVEVFRPGVEPEPIALDLAMRKISEVSEERQKAIKKMASHLLIMRRYNLLGLSIEELEEVIRRLP